MRKRILIILLLLGAVAAVTAEGYDLTATCPYDGGKAYFNSAKQTPDGGEACKYEHTRYDEAAHRTVTHSFWVPCKD
jgi:hypothetical protein